MNKNDNNNNISKCQNNIKTYYFLETKEYILVCHSEDKQIYIFRIKEGNLEQNFNSSYIDTKECKTPNNFFLFYDTSREEYNLMNDCYNNHTYISIYNISSQKVNNAILDSEITNPFINYQSLKKIILKKPIEQLISNYTYFKEIIQPGNLYEIKGPDYTITIKPINSYPYPNSTQINISQCEAVLKAKYNLSSTVLYLFQLELNNPKLESLINKVVFKIYDQNYKELNLNFCEGLNVEIIYKIKETLPINYTTIASFRDLGIDLFNISDIFFNDICRIYPDFENDIIIEDRLKDLYQNYSLCEEGCTYKGIDTNYRTVTCECNIKGNISMKIYDIKLNYFQISTNNLEIIKCYKLVFSSDDKINNIGFWIFTFILGAHVPLWFYYVNKGIISINDYIFNEMTKYGYLKKTKKK